MSGFGIRKRILKPDEIDDLVRATHDSIVDGIKNGTITDKNIITQINTQLGEHSNLYGTVVKKLGESGYEKEHYDEGSSKLPVFDETTKLYRALEPLVDVATVGDFKPIIQLTPAGIANILFETGKYITKNITKNINSFINNPEDYTQTKGSNFNFFDDNLKTTDLLEVNKNISGNVASKDGHNIDPNGTFAPSDIPLYVVIVVGAGRNIHASIIIMYNNIKYSIGLGFFGDSENNHEQIEKISRKVESGARTLDNFAKQRNGKVQNFEQMFKDVSHLGAASLYTKDYLIQPSRDNRIVGFGYLKEKHIYNLNNYLAKAKQLHYNNSTQSFYVSNMEVDYFSAGHNHFTNCSRFINDIFPNIHCGLGSDKSLNSPGLCYTNPPLERGDIALFYDYIRNPDVHITYDAFITFLDKWDCDDNNGCCNKVGRACKYFMGLTGLVKKGGKSKKKRKRKRNRGNKKSNRRERTKSLKKLR